jgi:HEAT repeat protein
VVGDADLSWVVAALSSPDPSVRAAAWRALGAYGWNRRLRDAIDLDAIPDEPASAVRADAYRALGVWGDAAALAAIDAAGPLDPDARAQVAAAETLVAQRGPDAAPAPRTTDRTADAPVRSDDAEAPATEVPPFDVAWGWAAEHARFDRLARDISRDRDRLYDEVRG